MKYRRIGPFSVSAVSYGCMDLAIEGRPDRKTSLDVIHRVLDAGVNHLDTAWSYYESGGEEEFGEKLVGEALRTWSGDARTVTVATKVGHTRNFDQDGHPAWGLDGDPEHLKAYARQSARALGVDRIDLLYFHRPDPRYSWEAGVRALAELRDQGLVRTVGISNADAGQIRLAHRILGEGLVAVQNQFSPSFRSSEPEIGVAAELGLAFVAWSPLGGYRSPKNPADYAPFERVARERGVSTAQVVLAWELAKGPNVIPIPGSHRASTILDSLKAVDLELSPEELASLG